MEKISFIKRLELKEKLKDIPEQPGVYLMKNDSKIIYVGKAKNLRNRVLSYFMKESDNAKTKELVKNIVDIEFFLCNTEVDALILENNLIKKHSPKYNIALKDEKTYPYLKLTKEKFPTLKTIRTTKELDNKNGIYFGPYPMGVSNLKKAIIRIFKIRDCSRDMDKVYSSPCLKYYMHFCTGPCVYKEHEKEYSEMVEGVIKVLKGEGKSYINILESKMKEASDKMRFEEAIVYRGQIQEIKNTVINQVTDYKKYIDEDYIVFRLEKKNIFIVTIGCRDGKIISKESVVIPIEDKIYEDIGELVIVNYYLKHYPPKNIIIDYELEDKEKTLKEWLQKNYNVAANFYFPKIKSRRRELLNMAQLNLDKYIESYYNKKNVIEKGLKEIHKILKLKNFPRRIECFDISNIQGKDAVASMSVSIEGVTTPKEYRKFKIMTKDTPDDFEMMREVITRRYSKLKKEEFPDMILIDGGLGQINAVGEILSQLGVLKYIDLVSIAKREEEIFKYGESIPYKFPNDDESIKIFQRVRDEAHRFGITYHRKLRSKRIISSELDKIKGIGVKRKNELYRVFKNYEGIVNASLEELKKVVPENIARSIKNKN